MFTLEHITWLCIAVAVCVFMLFLTGRKKLSLDANLTIMTVVLFISEAIKTINGMQFSEEFGGYYLSVDSLPFHLCSIQIFLVIYLKFFCRNENTRQKLLGFMFPTMLLGGVLAMLIPTCGTSITDSQVYQYFGYHMFISYFALYIVIFRIVRIDMKTILRNYLFLVGMMIAVLWIDSALQYAGANFMYLAYPPMEGLPLLNLDNGWYVYIAHLFSIGVILLFAVQYPCLILQRRVENSLC